jgi:hypothetical protein
MMTRTQIFILFFFFFSLLPATVSAATISLRAEPTRIGVGDTVRVDVLLDSAVPVNAFSGALSYSAALEPIAVSDGNSLINLWITRPVVASGDTPITFAGITPGGFSGNDGILFSILFRAKAAGTASVSLGDIEVLRNDGAGGNEPVIVKPLLISIGTTPFAGYTEPADTTPPESFTAFGGNDTQLFGGRDFVVFMAVDKGSGIDHYAVAESRVPSFAFRLFPLSWHTTTSPYVFADQRLTNTVYLKAVDRAGNERLSIYPPRHLLTAYEMTILLGILIGVVLLWQKKRKWGRRLKKNP